MLLCKIQETKNGLCLIRAHASHAIAQAQTTQEARLPPRISLKYGTEMFTEVFISILVEINNLENENLEIKHLTEISHCVFI